MSSLLLLASAAAEEGVEPSKAAFYIAGAALCAFAVLVAALGIVKHDFPASRGVRNVLLALGVLLAGAAMASSVLTA